MLEFPEMTSSTRRGHWLALITEIMLLNKFLSKYKVESEVQVWEMHARTILGIIRLHAAREMLRMCPPEPKSFLIFALLDELPKGDYILEELAESLKKPVGGNPCSASSILRSLNVSKQMTSESDQIVQMTSESDQIVQPVENLSSLEGAIHQAREEAKEIDKAKATTRGLKEEGIGESAQVLIVSNKPSFLIYTFLVEYYFWMPG